MKRTIIALLLLIASLTACGSPVTRTPDSSLVTMDPNLFKMPKQTVWQDPKTGTIYIRDAK